MTWIIDHHHLVSSYQTNALSIILTLCLLNSFFHHYLPPISSTNIFHLGLPIPRRNPPSYYCLSRGERKAATNCMTANELNGRIDEDAIGDLRKGDRNYNGDEMG